MNIRFYDHKLKTKLTSADRQKPSRFYKVTARPQCLQNNAAEY